MANPYGKAAPAAAGAAAAAGVSAPAGAANYRSKAAEFLAADAERRPCENIVLILSDRGGKTINSCGFVEVPDGGAGGDGIEYVATPPMPLPPGEKWILTFDSQSERSLRRRYGDAAVDETGVHIRHLGSMADPADPQSTVSMCETTVAILEGLADRDVAYLLLDRSDLFVEAAKKAVYAKAGVEEGVGETKPTAWHYRNKLVDAFFGAATRAVKRDGWLFLTGPKNESFGDEVTYFVEGPVNPRTGKASMGARKGTRESKWSKRFYHDIPAVLEGSPFERVGVDGPGGFGVSLVPIVARLDPFILGQAVDVTGRHIGAFWDQPRTSTPSTQPTDAEVSE